MQLDPTGALLARLAVDRRAALALSPEAAADLVAPEQVATELLAAVRYTTWSIRFINRLKERRDGG